MAKKVKKKLRDGALIEVDAAIVRWRKKLRAEGRVLGKNHAKQLEINRKQKHAAGIDRLLKKGKFNPFGE